MFPAQQTEEGVDATSSSEAASTTAAGMSPPSATQGRAITTVTQSTPAPGPSVPVRAPVHQPSCISNWHHAKSINRKHWQLPSCRRFSPLFGHLQGSLQTTTNVSFPPVLYLYYGSLTPDKANVLDKSQSRRGKQNLFLSSPFWWKASTEVFLLFLIIVFLSLVHLVDHRGGQFSSRVHRGAHADG